MNNDKAREFFSSYYEGALEHGLRQALELKLKSDPVLASDYAAFVETLRGLEAMKYEEIEVPVYLRDRIATRIESSSRQASKGWLQSFWVRGLALGGVAAGIFSIAFLAANSSQGSHPTAVGSVAPVTSVNSDQLVFNYVDGSVVLKYQPSSPKTVVVKSGQDDQELKRFNLQGQSLETKLSNPLSSTATFTVEVVGDPNRTTIALPGMERSTVAEGSGSLDSFAVALAGFYKVPVLVQASDRSRSVSWKFTTTDARVAATQALGERPYSVDQRPSGMIVIL